MMIDMQEIGFDALSPAEQVMFKKLRKVQTERMEHMKAESYSAGEKQRDHARKKASCMAKENVIIDMLEELGLYEYYRYWAWKK